MPLQSNLFKGDPKLEACLVHDSAHILIGAVGNHVSKIQTALYVLDQLQIDSQEITGKNYGHSTARAVLSFKQKRQIINYSYQTQADNIVGKMTIAALDREMLANENRRVRTTGCGDPVRYGGGGGGGGEQFWAPQLVSQQTAATTFPASLALMLQWTRAALTRSTSQQWRYFEKASSLLQPFDIEIGTPVPTSQVPFDDVIDDRFRDDIWKVRGAAEAASPGFANVLRVIACPFLSSTTAFALTEGGTHNGTTYQDFILLNAGKVRADQCTLLHEMIHATGLVTHDTDTDSVFSEGSTRTVLKSQHAARLGAVGTCFFARKK